MLFKTIGHFTELFVFAHVKAQPCQQHDTGKNANTAHKMEIKSKARLQAGHGGRGYPAP